MRDAAAEQLSEYKKSVSKPDKLTSGFGAPFDSVTEVLTAGPKGPIVLQDINFIESIARFDRERIPERVVHAKGAGAKGYFEVTHDITKYTKAALFAHVGKRTNVTVRFSTVGGESGSADTVRDPRGFAVKFYTDDGIFDLVGNNTPIFFIRDPILFPVFIHTQKRNPVTHLKDPDMFWDFITLRPETTHQVLFLFSDRGIPDGYRHMNGYGSHTFKFVNKYGDAYYTKFHFKPDQKVKNLLAEKAAQLAGTDPDYSTRDLYNAIHRGEFPSWTLYVQIMTPAQTEKFPWNPFDITKIWPHKDFPLIQVGKMVLNENPKDYFTEVEQIALSPNNMIPGIEPSPDKLLQGRLFSYSDTHRHRLGPNYLQLPINCPYRVRVSNYERDGPQALHNQDGAPNYYPNSFGGPVPVPDAKICPFPVSGNVARYPTGDDDNYSQPTVFWEKVLKPDEKERLVKNLVASLQDAADFIQERAIKNFSKVSDELSDRLTAQLKLAKRKSNL